MSQVDLDLIDRLRHDLNAASFGNDTVAALWGTEAASALSRGHRLPAQRALDLRLTAWGPEPLAVLSSLFVLGLPVTPDALNRALPTLRVSGACELGLAVEHSTAGNSEVWPLLDLRPYEFTDLIGTQRWWIASDLSELALGHAIPHAHVLGVGGASTSLSSLMIHTPVERVLDLGTGCGIQAFHAARHAELVIATDISERALEIAAFNASLNGIERIEFRRGSLFEPVTDEQFDHIVANPPFVITPRTLGVPEYEYRDGGMVGDAFFAAVLEGASRHLAPGGIAQFLGNWEYCNDRSGLDKVRDWGDEIRRDGQDLDSWVIEREIQDAAQYAETWIRDGGTRPVTKSFETLYEAWLNDFTARGVSRVGLGYVTLRRPKAGVSTLSRLEHVDSHGSNEFGLGIHLEQSLKSHDWQTGLRDEELAFSSITVAADVTEERHYWPGTEDPMVITLHRGGGFGRSIAVSSGLAALVGACDGDLSVGAIIGAVAQLLEVGEATLRVELLNQVRELLLTGFLLPPE